MEKEHYTKFRILLKAECDTLNVELDPYQLDIAYQLYCSGDTIKQICKFFSKNHLLDHKFYG